MAPQSSQPVVCFYLPDFASWTMARRWRHTSPSSAPIANPVVCEAGRVYSCSSDLRSRSGIAIGDTVDRARSLAPEAEFQLRDLEVERAIWDHLLARLYTLTPQIEPLTISAPSPCTSVASPFHQLTPSGAWAFLQNLDMDSFAPLVQQLCARSGVAPARSWALLAAARSYSRRVTTIPHGMIMPFLRQAPVALLEVVGFNPDLIEQLKLFGLGTIAHVTNLTKRHLSSQFGSEGEGLFHFLHPDDKSLISPYEPSVIGAEYDFDWPVFEPADLQPALTHLLEQLHTQLAGRSARHMEILLKGRSQEQSRRSSRILKDATSKHQILTGVATILLHQALNAQSGRLTHAGLAVYGISVELSGLSIQPSVQSQLFRPKVDIHPLARSMDVRFPGKLQRPVQSHADPFFAEEEYCFEPVCR